MTSYKIIKVITNNIVRAYDINDNEVILIGKGIGFSKRRNDIVSSSGVENFFVMQNPQEQSLYEQLIRSTSPKLVELANEAIDYIQNTIKKPLNDHIHVALTDHIAFMVRRCKMGVPVENPFHLEIENLYPEESKIARTIVQMLMDELRIKIPENEAAFITLHIVTAANNESFINMQKVTFLVSKLTSVIEEYTMTYIDKTSLNYTRLCTHLRFAVERIQRNEIMQTPPELEDVFKNQYPECYALAYRLVKIMQNELAKKVDSSEIIYLAIHLYRFIKAG